MRYIQRDENGNIVGHYANPQPYAMEEVQDDHPDIAAWQLKKEQTVNTISPLEQRLLDLESKLKLLSGE